MTADIRTAAQREADRRYPHTGRVDQTALVEGALRVGFKKGAVWAAERVTPTREQLAEAWEEGRQAEELAWEHAYNGHPVPEGEVCDECVVENPYRKAVQS